MANYYVCAGTGDDTTGDGTSGNPWATIQKALDTPAVVNDVIYLSNVAPFVLSAALTGLVSGLTFRGWDNGGSIVLTNTSDYCAEIDGNEAVSRFVNNTFSMFYRLKFHSFTSSLLGNTFHRLLFCEVYDSHSGGSGAMLGSGQYYIDNCFFHSFRTNKSLVTSFTGTMINSCVLDTISTGIFLANGILINNIIRHQGNANNSAAIDIGSNLYTIINNTIIKNNINTTQSVHGLYTTSNNTGGNIRNNLIASFNNTNSRGIYLSGASARISFSGPNAFYDNSTNFEMVSGLEHFNIPEFNSLDIDESSDPFEDATIGDYRLKSTALSRILSLPITDRNDFVKQMGVSQSFGAIPYAVVGGGGAGPYTWIG